MISKRQYEAIKELLEKETQSGSRWNTIGDRHINTAMELISSHLLVLGLGNRLCVTSAARSEFDGYEAGLRDTTIKTSLDWYNANYSNDAFNALKRDAVYWVGDIDVETLMDLLIDASLGISGHPKHRCAFAALLDYIRKHSDHNAMFEYVLEITKYLGRFWEEIPY